MTFFLVAGEPSGDRLGAALMRSLLQLEPTSRFMGIAGSEMLAAGMESLFPMDELSIMGLVEILPKYLHLKRRIRQTAEAVIDANPDALITIDSPDFGLRVAALVKAARPTIRTIHYVAPSVWAWRPDRAVKMARYIDHVLALLPFEPPYMQAAGMTCDFVGHPVVSDPLATPEERAVFTGKGPLLLALPGSRKVEVTRLVPILGQTLSRLKAQHPDLRLALPTVSNIEPLVRSLTAQWPVKPDIITDPARKRGAFAAADVAIAASGTVSLELAANDCPMVVVYDMNPLTLWLMRRVALIETVTLVNLVSETRTIPEFIGPDATSDRIVPAVLGLLSNSETHRQAMQITMQRLGKGGEPPGLRAARSVLTHL
ncbi:MAG: lipid-A-disaccharide synthase [Rhodobacteraceae bacterium]|nr:lipid-A-disaccharide synthase [Paracoccaceae bacterium]